METREEQLLAPTTFEVESIRFSTDQLDAVHWACLAMKPEARSEHLVTAMALIADEILAREEREEVRLYE